MFERLLIAALFWLLPSFAMAQQVYCPTRSPGDNSNACASTAYVNNLFPSTPLSVPQGGTGNTSFTANLPLIGNGTSPIALGSVIGSTTTFATIGASHVNGNCAQFSAGNLIDSGAPCGSGGSGSGTVASGTAGQLGYYGSTGTTISGFGYGTAGQVLSSGGASNPPAWQNKMLSIADYGAKCNEATFTDGSISATSTTFNTSSSHFVSGDVGKVIRVSGAGAAGAMLVTTIASYTSATQVSLTAAASTTVASGATWDYGTDDTTAIQNAWNAGATLGLNVNLSGAGVACFISTLTMPAVASRGIGVGPPVASALIGNGPNSVELISTATGTNCAIAITETYASYQPNLVMGGFALVSATGNTQPTPTSGGYGICITNTTQWTLTNVWVGYFGKGLFAEDSINITVRDSVFESNGNNVYAQKVTNTNPNVYRFASDRFARASQYAIFINHGTSIVVEDCTFEQNGTNSGLAPTTIYLFGNSVNGMFRSRIKGNYTELDGGPFVTYQSISGDTIPAVDDFQDNNVLQMTPVHEIEIAAGASVNQYINVQSNGFYSNQTPPNSIFSTSGANWQVYCLGNSYTNSSDMPTKCQVPGASATWSMDTSAQYGGP